VTVWERRDLPVLKALATSNDENLRHGFLSVADNALGLDLTAGELHDAIFALNDVQFVEGEVGYESGPSAHFTHLTVTGRGQQALGEWPLFDELTSPETLALFLERLADEASTDEEADSMRRAARYARSLGAGTLRAAIIGVLAQLAKAAMGLG
jgi:hypothetical protein